MDKLWQQNLPISGIKDIVPISGGDVNDAYRIDTEDDKYFLLVQPNSSYDFYSAEAEGLNDFEYADVTAPSVVSKGEIAGDAYMILTWLDEGTTGSQEALGKLVAKLHEFHNPDKKFGFDYPDNGPDIAFDNSWTDSWKEIFVHRRLDHLREKIVEKNLWDVDQLNKFDNVREVIVEELDNHKSKASLLHGDLWGGNYMFLKNGDPALFDPMPLYGDREFDLGATRVFGGFSPEFYEAYDKAYPLADGAERRIEFYKLYLLLVHLVKFGLMYESSVETSMDKILADAKQQ
ncbi:fructosamine kinase family protein [Staphylococcus carnosus]|uniref:Fructosamine kinase n=1 Tax=Staphylococcus carnosus TaxID=1281 RepID=A0AAJ0JPY4_STACA|nr:fructosamine kinase family protein [Staphylococcus carnosus]KKB25869.1 fructosamine kinase [Staphylococcus carnosus]POA02792.1 fructosamine kinase [Staphylococcus carnosus]QQS84395.1 fructosamine kinase family protein [Staphylococcus carnosus]QRQ04335.1 fructosamine kinase family protein [Staphylococcus carnosus]UTB83664.1 fructosamine kinase [Staphylococcus carnosus]